MPGICIPLEIARPLELCNVMHALGESTQNSNVATSIAFPYPAGCSMLTHVLLQPCRLFHQSYVSNILKPRCECVSLFQTICVWPYGFSTVILSFCMLALLLSMNNTCSALEFLLIIPQLLWVGSRQPRKRGIRQLRGISDINLSTDLACWSVDWSAGRNPEGRVESAAQGAKRKEKAKKPVCFQLKKCQTFRENFD